MDFASISVQLSEGPSGPAVVPDVFVRCLQQLQEGAEESEAAKPGPVKRPSSARPSGGQMASAPTPPAPLVVQDGICVKWRCITKQMMWRGITFEPWVAEPVAFRARPVEGRDGFIPRTRLAASSSPARTASVPVRASASSSGFLSASVDAGAPLPQTVCATPRQAVAGTWYQMSPRQTSWPTQPVTPRIWRPVVTLPAHPSPTASAVGSAPAPVTQPALMTQAPMYTVPAVDGLRDLFSGMVSGFICKVVEYPADTIKVLEQTGGSRFSGPLDCFSKTLAESGFFSLYRGLSAPLLGSMAECASLFVSYGYVKKFLGVDEEAATLSAPVPFWKLVLAGGGSGFASTCVLTPVELIKCRLQAQLNQPTTSQSYRGQSHCVVWGEAQQLEKKKDVALQWSALSGSAAGVAYWALPFPADTVKSKIQTDARFQSQSFISVFKTILKEDGGSLQRLRDHLPSCYPFPRVDLLLLRGGGPLLFEILSVPASLTSRRVAMRHISPGFLAELQSLRMDEAERKDNVTRVLPSHGPVLRSALLKASLPLAKSFATKLWNGEYLRQVKTSLVDEDVTTLLYREAENALMDAAVLYLPSREVVTSPKFSNFFQSMGDRLVVVTNPENAAAGWRVENMGADFYDNSDVGLEICKVFAQQSYYYQLIFSQDLNYNLVKLGESETKPNYDQILAWTEAYEDRTDHGGFGGIQCRGWGAKPKSGELADNEDWEELCQWCDTCRNEADPARRGRPAPPSEPSEPPLRPPGEPAPAASPYRALDVVATWNSRRRRLLEELGSVDFLGPTARRVRLRALQLEFHPDKHPAGEQHFAQEMFLLVQSRWEEDERTRRQRQEEQQRAEQQAAEQLRKAEEAWRRQEAQKAKEEALRKQKEAEERSLTST
eukprot:g13902.t1